MQAKRELARKVVTIGTDHAAEMAAASRRAATELKEAERKCTAAENALGVMESAHHDAVEEIAALKAAHEAEIDTRMQAAEAAQEEMLALQEHNVELTVRALRSMRCDPTAIAMFHKHRHIQPSLSSTECTGMLAVVQSLIGCFKCSGDACSNCGSRAGAAPCGGAGDNEGAR